MYSVLIIFSTKDTLIIFEKLKEKGVIFVCLSPDIDFSTSVGQLLLTVLMAVHQLERENISMHVRNNMRQLSNDNKLRSKPPFGYRFVAKDRDFEPVPEQMAVIEKIKEMYQNQTSYSEIARKLNESGDNACLSLNKRRTSGKTFKFYPETIRRILIDHGMVGSDDMAVNRAPIATRIVSHKKVNLVIANPQNTT